MTAVFQKFRASPFVARVLPFIIFAGLTSCQGLWGENSRYWIYALKTLIGMAFIFAVRPAVKEMEWKFSWQALVVGVAVFALWVALDPRYRHFTKPNPWNPNVQFGQGTALAWLFIAIRLAGSTLVVPPHERFYRATYQGQ